MTLTVHTDLTQGSDEWLAARLGMVTASVVGQLLSVGPPSALTVACPECGAPADSPCLSRARKEPAPIKTLHGTRVAPFDAPPVIQVAANDTSRGLITSLVAERITGHIDPVYVSDDMLRGTMDEPIARDLYSQHYAPVTEVGFMVREESDWRLGFSPDGLVGDDGLIEAKSRKSKIQLQTILTDQVPAANMAQIQAGLLVTGRKWCDYLSYCGGMPMWRIRVTPDQAWFDAIIAAVKAFEVTASAMTADYYSATDGMPVTERVDHFQEMAL